MSPPLSPRGVTRVHQRRLKSGWRGFPLGTPVRIGTTRGRGRACWLSATSASRTSRYAPGIPPPSPRGCVRPWHSLPSRPPSTPLAHPPPQGSSGVPRMPVLALGDKRLLQMSEVRSLNSNKISDEMTHSWSPCSALCPASCRCLKSGAWSGTRQRAGSRSQALR